MKIYSCVVTIAVEDDTYSHPRKWDWDELIGENIKAVDVYDVTERDIEGVRLTSIGTGLFVPGN